MQRLQPCPCDRRPGGPPHQKAGYEVESVRITTQPFTDYTRGLSRDDALAFLREYDAFIEAESKGAGVEIDPNIGPAMIADCKGTASPRGRRGNCLGPAASAQLGADPSHVPQVCDRKGQLALIAHFASERSLV